MLYENEKWSHLLLTEFQKRGQYYTWSYVNAVILMENHCIYFCRFAHQNVVKSCVLLLADFAHNSSHTNHCAAKLLHRIAFDHHMVALLYQARLFRVFARLLTDPVYCTTSQYRVTLPSHFAISSSYQNVLINNSVAHRLDCSLDPLLRLTYTLQSIKTVLLALLWHAPLGMCSAKHGHQSPEWTILS